MPVSCRTHPHARRLRRDATDVEQRFWLAVRDRRLAGYKFRRQASIGPFVVDFLRVQRRLIVEIDGGQHGSEADRRRTTYLEDAGYRVLRFWNNEMLESPEGVLASVIMALDPPGPPSPNPLPPAGEG